MSIVQPEAIKYTGQRGNIVGHVLPEEGGIGGAVAVSEFDRVIPDVDGASEIVPSDHCEVLLGLSIHDPPIVRHARPLLVGELTEIALDYAVLGSDLLFILF